MTYLDDLQMVRHSFLKISKHANGLALGLQNAAPPQPDLPPSIQYLLEITEQLNKKLHETEELIQEFQHKTTLDSKERHKKLIDIVNDVLATDIILRENFKIGERFRFVRDQLEELLTQLKQSTALFEKSEIVKNAHSETNEELIYVYLFNAHGLTINSWVKMLTPKVFYEHSINRPIYKRKEDIESFIRNKSNKAQHAYFIISIKKEDILQNESGKDLLGNNLMKVREGSLNFEKLISFFHNDVIYTIDEEKGLIKKSL